MKAAIVMFLDSASIQQQTGDINARLKDSAPRFHSVALWLFYKGAPPASLPGLDCSLSVVKLVAVKHDAPLPESYLQLLLQLTDRLPMDLILFPSGGLGQELATRLAHRLNGNACLQTLSYCPAGDTVKVTKPVYGNNLKATFILTQPPYCLAMAKQPCRPMQMVPLQGHNTEIITLNEAQCDWVKATVTIPDQSNTGLADADLVIVVGQGASDKATVDRIKGIAARIGAGLGASRPVVMNAWTDMNRLIGASGLILSPRLCIIAGVSGSAVFTAGIRASDFIVAINTDPKAPIFQIAHVGLVGEMLPILMELEKVILTEKTGKTLPTHPGSGTDG